MCVDGFCVKRSRTEKWCRTQHKGGPYLTMHIMLVGTLGLFCTVNKGRCQDF